ncbi:MAG: hypothetical protein JWQ43_4199 [Glaciihabitans sp.]|nr:hypothetical protein [Glaciihabitans sp.]
MQPDPLFTNGHTHAGRIVESSVAFYFCAPYSCATSGGCR